MPGSIRVSVLEAKELKAGDGKMVTAKVSIGKKEYRTQPLPVIVEETPPWNADFTFPVLNLKDNLSVVLLDESEEVIGKTDIQTPSIVEKGFRDEFLTLNSGGKIHLKLSFVLSDEERKRIEQMRSSSTKKKPDGVKTPTDLSSSPVAGAQNLMSDSGAEAKAASDLSSPFTSAAAPDGKISSGIVQQKIQAFEGSLKPDAKVGTTDPSVQGGLDRLKSNAVFPSPDVSDGRAFEADKDVTSSVQSRASLDKLKDKSVVFDERVNGDGKVKAKIAKARQASPAEKGGNGLGKLFTQIVGGAAVVAGLVLLWPRDEEDRPETPSYGGHKSDEKSRFYMVQPGDTLSRIVPDQCYNYDSSFFKLNPQVCDRNLIYAGQNLRLK